jgi:hypothetical protein
MYAGKVLTQDNLKKRNIQGPSKCVLCNQSKETLVIDTHEDLIDIHQILKERTHFSHLKFYHGLREHNSWVDMYANDGVELIYNQLMVDDDLRFAHPP